MAAHYDTFDYPAYWKEREYEHKSEILAISQFLENIKEINSVIDIGGGYGRLIPTYAHRAKKITVTDPSKKLLSLAKKSHTDNKIIFLQSKLENLKPKLKSKKFDLALIIRVLHHIKNPEEALKVASSILKPGGYLILEFPNKLHGKAQLINFIKGNFTFPIDISPIDIRSKKNIKKNTITFQNYHPDTINKCLQENGFTILEKHSVSNIRSNLAKIHLPINFLISLERLLQKPLAKINFGPSIFILAQKS